MVELHGSKKRKKARTIRSVDTSRVFDGFVKFSLVF